jgi:hypothetical protein
MTTPFFYRLSPTVTATVTSSYAKPDVLYAERWMTWDEAARMSLGDYLYPLVTSNLDAGKETMVHYNLWVPSMTPGKIVGMLLDGLSLDELTVACSDSKYLAEIMVDACEVLMEAAGREPFRP